METKFTVNNYIKLREEQFILEGRFYCSDIKTPDTRCNKQCDTCKKAVDEKINEK